MDVGRSTFDVRRFWIPNDPPLLRALEVGARFKSEPYSVTEAAIIAFAREFDVQPFHLDPAAAEQSVFKGLAASGWHTAAIAMRLFTTGPMRFAGGAIGMGVDELRWPVAVRPGDTLRLETEVLENEHQRLARRPEESDTLRLETEVLEMRLSKSRARHGIIRIRNVLTRQTGEVVLTYEANALVPRRPKV